MNSLFEEKRLFLVGGSGGVGKTTLAAALGLGLAQQGFRTAVLTVDTARRLAQALGFSRFQTELQKIPLQSGTGELWASMLDAEHYFDRVIEKFASSEAQREKVLKNPLYRTMVESLGGSHEYAAMERLLEFIKDPRFDKVVVDTPPSDNARELFEAPQRLADFMDNSVLRWFQGGGKLYLQFFRTGTRLAMSALKLVFGGEFLNSLGEFMADLEGMQAGFRGRNLEVIEILQSPACAFFLVTVPSEARFSDCQSFQQTLREKKIPLSRLILNRLESPCPQAFALSGADQEALTKILRYQASLYQNQCLWSDKIQSLVHCPVLKVPRRSGALHDVCALSGLGHLLLQ